MQPFEPSQKNLNRSPLDDPRVLSGPFWGELRVFLAVAKAKSFNRAADELNMSQPTVSRQVKRLQDIMGTQLLVPTQTGIRLTVRGHELAESLLALDEKLFEIAQDLKAETREAGGLVRVSVTDALAGLFVAPSLVAFGDRYPKIKLHIRNPSNMTSFKDNQTDIMIGFAPSASDEVSSRPLGCMHFIPIATQQYITRHGIPTRNNVASHFFIDSEHYSAQTGMWKSWHAVLAQGSIAHYCDNSFSYALLVKSGLGIGLLGTYCLADPGTVPLELDVHIRIPLFALAHSERLTARPVRLVYDWLSEVFGPANPWFAAELNLPGLPRDSLADTAAQLLGDQRDTAA